MVARRALLATLPQKHRLSFPTKILLAALFTLKGEGLHAAALLLAATLAGCEPKAPPAARAALTALTLADLTPPPLLRALQLAAAVAFDLT